MLYDALLTEREKALWDKVWTFARTAGLARTSTRPGPSLANEETVYEIVNGGL